MPSLFIRVSPWSEDREGVMATSVPSTATHKVAAEIKLDRLFVPYDFTPLSERALDYARRIARHNNAEIVLAHISPPVSPMAVPEAAWYHLQAAENKELQQLERIGARLRAEGLDARTVTRNGLLQDEVPCCCKEAQTNLIVLGADIKSGLDRLVFGSDEEVLFRNSGCPVLVIGPRARPAPDKPWHPSDVLCATNLHPECAQHAAFGWRLAQKYEASFTILHAERRPSHSANDEQRRFELALAQFVPSGEIPADAIRTTPADRGACAAIVAAARERQTDILVMGTHSCTHASTRLLRGTVSQVIAEAPCPVLVLQTPC
jgi:nucleotide-binding universal stress UspA family protein